MEKSEEILKAIEATSDGMWLPMATITGVLSIVILLLIYIWKQSQSVNNKRHLDNESMIHELKDTTKTMSDILIEIRTSQKYQQKEIDNLIKS